jgi:S-DNA-T family DNA segregation ATPase FtsK/SpoIIIE
VRLKLTVRSERGDHDVVVSCDATATVGDVASALFRQTAEQRLRQPVTLWTDGGGRTAPRVLSPLLSVHEAGIGSGALVSVTSPEGADDAFVTARATVVVEEPRRERRTVPLGDGVAFIGRDPATQIRLGDPKVSRRHASLQLDRVVSVTDRGSANGITVDGERVERAVLSERSELRIGDTVLRVQGVVPVGGADAGPAPFSRSPRVASAWAERSVQAPELPRSGEKPRLPWIGVVAPIIMGVTLFAITKNPLMLVFVALSPVIMLGTWLDQRIRNRRETREAAERFAAGFAALEEELSGLREQERQGRLAESPAIAEVAAAVQQRAPLLWTRMPEHHAFLRLRLGTGALPSRTTVPLPTRSIDALEEWQQLRELIERHETIDAVPVTEQLADAGSLGIAGDARLAAEATRAWVLQLAGLHSPTDVALCAFVTGDGVDEWEWLKWLPHLDSPHSPLRAPLAHDWPSGTRLLAQLEELVEARTAQGGSRSLRSHLAPDALSTGSAWAAVDRAPATPVVVALVIGEPPADRGRLVALSQEGADAGVHIVWIAPSAAQLPVVCRTHLLVEPAGAAVHFVRHGRVVPLETVELLTAEHAAQLARSLAPLEDDGAPVLDESDLPRRVGFAELLDDGIAEGADALVARWRRSDSLTATWKPGASRQPNGIPALVGQGAAAPFRIDLRRDGPHALVGGTTGSGKSEFLQTWILGMAMELSPDRLTFLLVDYKGGSAFGECVALPHTVGLVTDLTPHLVRRALTSLRAELHRREELLAAKDAKDLETLEERGDPEAPPALVIVIDEFAALATEVPEFVDGVIDVAQRGRSLGLHLIMATQRPAGVIKESLRANTNLRVALRVADEADSQDVLGVARAAHFDPGVPGRAAAKLGAGRVLDFQTAYVGGRSDTAHVPEVQINDLPFAEGRTWPAVEQRAKPTGPRDIERITDAVRRAADLADLDVPRRPWLDALPEVIDLDTLPQGAGLTIGLIDEPARQRQSPYALDLDSVGSLAIFGASGTGKTTVLRSIAATALAGDEPAWIYGLDFSGGALQGLRPLPGVGAIVNGGDTERVRRLLGTLEQWTAERSRMLGAANAATLTEYNALSAHPLPRIIVLVDGMATFRAEYEFVDNGALFDGFAKLVAGGRQVGVHFVLGADRQAAIPQAVLAGVQRRIALRLASSAEYDLLGAPRDVLDDAPAGRALVGALEVQFAVPGGSTELAQQALALNALAERLAPSDAPPIARLEERIPLDELPATVGGWPVFGVADDTLDPVGIPTSGLFVITGPFGSGRTTAVRTAVASHRAGDPQLRTYLLAARRSALAEEPWTEAATDLDATEALATRLAGDLVPGMLIVVEGVSDYEGTNTEGVIARLLKAARRAGVAVIAEADTVTSGSAWQIHSELKTARAGIVLQPEESDGASIFRVPFPRATRADFPLGRGFLITDGRVRRVQVALPPQPTAVAEE